MALQLDGCSGVTQMLMAHIVMLCCYAEACAAVSCVALKILLVQLQPAALTGRMARDKTAPNTNKAFNNALFRAVVKHFKSAWDKEERDVKKAAKLQEGT